MSTIAALIAQPSGTRQCPETLSAFDYLKKNISPKKKTADGRKFNSFVVAVSSALLSVRLLFSRRPG